MPKVGSKKFPYTAAGMKAAKKASKKSGSALSVAKKGKVAGGMFGSSKRSAAARKKARTTAARTKSRVRGARMGYGR